GVDEALICLDIFSLAWAVAMGPAFVRSQLGLSGRKPHHRWSIQSMLTAEGHKVSDRYFVAIWIDEPFPLVSADQAWRSGDLTDVEPDVPAGTSSPINPTLLGTEEVRSIQIFKDRELK